MVSMRRETMFPPPMGNLNILSLLSLTGGVCVCFSFSSSIQRLAMRPGTTSNLSFHSSSDCSLHLVPLYEYDASLASVAASDLQYTNRPDYYPNHPRGGISDDSSDRKFCQEGVSAFGTSQDARCTRPQPASSTREVPRSPKSPSRTAAAFSSATGEHGKGGFMGADNHESFKDKRGLSMAPKDSGSLWTRPLRGVTAGVQNCGKALKDSVNHAVGRILGIESSSSTVPAHLATSPVGTDSFAVEKNIRGLDSPSSPFYSQKPQNDREAIRTECIFVGVDHGSNVLSRPMKVFTNYNSDKQQLLGEWEDGESVGVENEAPAYEVDLISALKSYLENPNECFSHLVSAALASRSAKRPVTGAELEAAQHNPFLVRLIVASGCLDVEDPLARQQVQETLDALFPLDSNCLPPTLYDYLNSFLQLPFVRLSYKHYVLLKMSGFEYIILLCKYPHVLSRDKFYTILFNYSPKMLLCNWIFAFIALIVNTLIILTICFSNVIWFYTGNKLYQINGIYCLLVLGGSYVLNLVAMVYFTQKKEETSSYEDTGTLQPPSLYVVLFIFPVYELICLITLTRALRRNKLVLAHNILALSRISGMCITMAFVIPQTLAQRYLISIVHDPDVKKKIDLSFSLLTYLGIGQWGLALFRCAYMMIVYDSIDHFGYASFKRTIPKNYLERHPAVPVINNHYTVYVAELALYTVIISFVEINNTTKCENLVILLIATSMSFLLATTVMFTALGFKDASVGYVSFFNIITVCFLVGTKVVIALSYVYSDDERCNHYATSISYNFPLVNVLWSVYEVLFVAWVLLVLWWPLRRFVRVNIFQCFVFPLLRRLWC